MQGDSFNHSEKVVFYCDENYQLVGQSQITCQDGSWSDLLPKCIGTLQFFSLLTILSCRHSCVREIFTHQYFSGILKIPINSFQNLTSFIQLPDILKDQAAFSVPGKMMDPPIGKLTDNY